jgi:tetratricopeptide (TPR) repeat protein
MRFLILGILLWSNAGRLADSIAVGDEHFYRMEYPAALSMYTSALGDTASKGEALWRLSRTLVFMGEVARGEARDSLFRRAELCARECTRIEPANFQGYTWLAASLANIARREDTETQIALVHAVRSIIDTALTLNPENDVAYSVLGSLCRALGGVTWVEKRLADLLFGGLPDGGYEEAEQAFRRAITIAPGVMRYHFELGKLYIDMNRPDDARREFHIAASLPPRVAGDRNAVRRMEKMLLTLDSQK